VVIGGARVEDNTGFEGLLLDVLVIAAGLCGILLIEMKFASIGTIFVEKVGTDGTFGVYVVVRVTIGYPRVARGFDFSSSVCALTSLHGKYTILS